MWIRKLLADMKLKNLLQPPVLIFEDNQAAIGFSKSPESAKLLNKQAEIDDFFIQEKIESNNFEINYINSVNQEADIFSKPVQRSVLLRIRPRLNLC